RNQTEQEHEEHERGARLAPTPPNLDQADQKGTNNRKGRLEDEKQGIKVDWHSAPQMGRVVVIETTHHEVAVMRYRVSAGIVQHVLERARQQDYRVEHDEKQRTGAEQEDRLSPPSRRLDSFIAAKVVVEKIQAQVMRKVFGG